jgi:hypothetical protein
LSALDRILKMKEDFKAKKEALKKKDEGGTITEST